MPSMMSPLLPQSPPLFYVGFYCRGTGRAGLGWADIPQPRSFILLVSIHQCFIHFLPYAQLLSISASMCVH
uniref:Uncharacterized protein n=1 Tax=Physcomitrium patens TaxID=3218 RepID=A0A2K1JR85_PHYPA|nr:hypothetical protein PHYPA_016428 [Physcomitrium patens]